MKTFQIKNMIIIAFKGPLKSFLDKISNQSLRAASIKQMTPITLNEKSILREFTNIRKYSVNKWNCMHYPFAILFS